MLIVALIGFVFTASVKQDRRDKIESDVQNIEMDYASIWNLPGVAADLGMAARLMRDEKIIAKYKRLLAAEEEHPYDPKRIAKMSLYLAACGLRTCWFIFCENWFCAHCRPAAFPQGKSGIASKLPDFRQDPVPKRRETGISKSFGPLWNDFRDLRLPSAYIANKKVIRSVSLVHLERDLALRA